MDIMAAILMEMFVSLHMTVFVLLPISKFISQENSRKVFWILFVVRIVVLFYCDFLIF